MKLQTLLNGHSNGKNGGRKQYEAEDHLRVANNCIESAATCHDELPKWRMAWSASSSVNDSPRLASSTNSPPRRAKLDGVLGFCCGGRGFTGKGLRV